MVIGQNRHTQKKNVFTVIQTCFQDITASSMHNSSFTFYKYFCPYSLFHYKLMFCKKFININLKYLKIFNWCYCC